MSVINRQSEDNYGGLAKLYYARQQDVYDILGLEEALLRGSTGISISQATIDANFDELQFNRRTANHDQVERHTDAGPVYTHQIEARFARDRAEISAHRRHVKNYLLVMLFQNMNGDWKLVYGHRLRSDHRTGKEPKDANGSTLQYSAELPIPALEVTIT